ncbi:MAG: hypothetical protein ACXACA_04095 [Candidatus Ranarchaeia archaeon]
MNKNRMAFSLSAMFFVIDFLIMLDQYLQIGIWFQLKDIHHETFTLSSFTQAIAILIGSYSTRNDE